MQELTSSKPTSPRLLFLNITSDFCEWTNLSSGVHCSFRLPLLEFTAIILEFFQQF
jgi:hypothetical protein